MEIAYLALGSNLGDRLNYLQLAIHHLAQDENIKVLDYSKVYETAPVGGVPQDHYLNAVVKIETGYSPEELLVKINKIEEEMKRTREVRWGPRTLDIDILLYGKIRIETSSLIIPHKEMKKRGFVLIPLADVAQDDCLEGNSLQELIKKTDDYQEVHERYDLRKEENK